MLTDDFIKSMFETWVTLKHFACTGLYVDTVTNIESVLGWVTHCYMVEDIVICI